MGRKLRIAFVHPDLGIGGAERLVVDAAVGLQAAGHTVHMFTSHHEASHCFEETRDGTLAVTVYGDFLPTRILGFFSIVCAIVRQLYLALVLLVRGERYDVVFVDQLSAAVPLLRLRATAVFFYCHFPDKHLVRPAPSLLAPLKSLYRWPMDKLEEVTMGGADRIVVNSAFTRSVFDEAFPSLRLRFAPDVLYPAINFAMYDAKEREAEAEAPREKGKAKRGAADEMPGDDEVVFLSINRFEVKKNLALAVRAFARIRDVDAALYARSRLVLAGGYDVKNEENVSHFRELQALATKLSVAERVLWKPSFSEDDRRRLLAAARCCVYTPDREHFGIVPVEAMYSSRPVIAVNSGGPKETVVDGKTGLLVRDTPADFCSAMRKLGNDARLAAKMGADARESVVTRFGLDRFTRELEAMLVDLVEDVEDARKTR